jgi:hypothetical protein
MARAAMTSLRVPVYCKVVQTKCSDTGIGQNAEKAAGEVIERRFLVKRAYSSHRGSAMVKALNCLAIGAPPNR